MPYEDRYKEFEQNLASVEYDYSDKPISEVIQHLVRFTADLWLLHPFTEGNTRTIQNVTEDSPKSKICTLEEESNRRN